MDRLEEATMMWKREAEAATTTPSAVDIISKTLIAVSLRLSCAGIEGDEKTGPTSDECASFPQKTMENCKKLESQSKCETQVREVVEEYCDKNGNSAACKWLDQFTTTTTTELAATTSSNKMVLIIGAIVGVVFLLAVGIGLFCFCRKKKAASAPPPSMDGVSVKSSKDSTTGGTTGTTGTTKTTTVGKGGTTATTKPTGGATTRY